MRIAWTTTTVSECLSQPTRFDYLRVTLLYLRESTISTRPHLYVVLRTTKRAYPRRRCLHISNLANADLMQILRAIELLHSGTAMETLPDRSLQCILSLIPNTPVTTGIRPLEQYRKKACGYWASWSMNIRITVRRFLHRRSKRFERVITCHLLAFTKQGFTTNSTEASMAKLK